MKPDIVGIIEASYSIEGMDQQAWLAELLERARPSLDRGLGVAAYFADVWADRYGGPEPIGLGLPDDWRETFHTMTSPEAVTPAIRRRVALQPPVTTLSQNLGRRLFASVSHLQRGLASRRPVRDWLGIKVLDPTGRGIIMCAPMPRVATVSPAVAATWSKVAGHIAAGYRLRRRLAAVQIAKEGLAGPAPRTGGDWVPQAEAVLHPAGDRVVHAVNDARSREARDALQAGARMMDLARGRLRRSDPAEAVSIRLGLVSGRWTLVDQEERDGRRYLLAYRNEASVDSWPRGRRAWRLSAREHQILAFGALGHSNKLIAYELGLASSTVSVLLARAQAKLGASSKNEMLALYRAALAASGAERA